MNSRISLRMRLTLITSLILLLVCISFTVFSWSNMRINLVEPIDNIVTTSSNGQIYYFSMIDESEPASSNQFIAAFRSGVAKVSFISIVFMVCIIMIGSVSMYVFSGFMLKPVETLSMQISQIDKNKLSSRIRGYTAGDELTRLVESFNEMMDRLEDTFRRETRFASDAAHELKTPLTIIKTNLDILFMDGQPPYEECIKNSLQHILIW